MRWTSNALMYVEAHFPFCLPYLQRLLLKVYHCCSLTPRLVSLGSKYLQFCIALSRNLNVKNISSLNSKCLLVKGFFIKVRISKSWVNRTATFIKCIKDGEICHSFPTAFLLILLIVCLINEASCIRQTKVSVSLDIRTLNVYICMTVKQSRKSLIISRIATKKFWLTTLRSLNEVLALNHKFAAKKSHQRRPSRLVNAMSFIFLSTPHKPPGETSAQLLSLTQILQKQNNKRCALNRFSHSLHQTYI